MSKHPPKNFTRFLLTWGAVFFFGLLLYRFRYILIDDPYITFQYARNFVEGHGLVFNPGERVEGYSNFLWVWVSAFFIFLGLQDPLMGVQAVSVLLAFGLILLMAKGIGGRWIGPDDRRLGDAPFGTVLLATSYPFAVWSWGALETIQFSVVVFLCVLFTARCALRPGRWTPYTLGVLLLLGGLSRPEGPMVLIFPLTFLVLHFLRERRLSTAFVISLTVFSSGYILYLLFRFVYYGTIIPNTVTAKVGGSLINTLRNGFGYFFEYAIGAPLLLFGLCLLLLIRSVAQWLGKRESEATLLVLLCSSFIFLQIVFCVLVGGDWMPGMRFIVPLLPCLCFVAGRQLERFPRFVAFVLLGFFVLTVPIEAHRERIFNYQSLEWLRRSAQHERTTISLQRVGEEIATLASGTETIALSEVGVIPYYSRLRTIDMLGLIDPEIALQGGGLHENFNGKLVLDRKPEFILLIMREVAGKSESGEPTIELLGEFAPERSLIVDPRFSQSYTEIKRWPRKIMNPRDLKIYPGYFVLYKRLEGQAP